MDYEQRICLFPNSKQIVFYHPSGTHYQPTFRCQALVLGRSVDTAEPEIAVTQNRCLAQIATGICPLNKDKIQLGLS